MKNRFQNASQILVIVISLILPGLLIFGQEAKEYVQFPSPNAASLGTYGEIPVGHFTGVPNINIPIYEVKSGKASLPISLSYHTSSVKLNTHPSWVGLGWTLQAGGAITRKQNGKIDELKSDWYNEEYGFYGRQNHANQLFADSRLNNYKRPPVASTYGYDYDHAADEFSFNFLGYSGSFMLDGQGNWRVFSDQNIKLEFNPSTDFSSPDDLPNQFINLKGAHSGQTYVGTFNYNNVSRYFNVFTLITPDGIRYTFGGERGVEYNVNYYYQAQSFPIPVTWFLTKVEDLHGNTIELTYEYGDFIATLNRTRSYKRTTYSDDSFGGASCSQFAETHKSPTAGISGQMTLPLYLKKISSNNNNIIFNRSISNELRYEDWMLQFNSSSSGIPGALSSNMAYIDHWNELQWYKLHSIYINTANNRLIKSFGLNYIENPNERLKLESIVERGESIGPVMYAEKAPHVFRYDNKKMAPYLSENADHWGYYNGYFVDTLADGAQVNSDFYSNSNGNISVFNNYYYDSREPNIRFAKAEILEQITYPTGGKTRFDYELNDFSYVVSEDRQRLETQGGSIHIAGGDRPPCEGYPIYTSSFQTWGEDLDFNLKIHNCTGFPLGIDPLEIGQPYPPGSSGTLVELTIEEFPSRIPVATFIFDDYSNPLYEYNGKLEDLFGVTLDPNKTYQIYSKASWDLGEPGRPYISMKLSLSGGSFQKTGGLRIKKIKNYPDIITPPYITEYDYTKSFQNQTGSSGILGGKVQYLWKDFEAQNDNGNEFTFDLFSSSSFLPFGINGQGSHIGYSQVTETKKDIYGNTMGKTVYEYSNFDKDIWGHAHMDVPAVAWIDSMRSVYSPFTSKAFERGHLMKVSIYNENEDLLQVTRNKYAVKSDFGIPQLDLGYTRLCAVNQFTPVGAYVTNGTLYGKYNNHFLLQSTETKEFFPNDVNSGSFQTVKSFEYNNDNQIVLEKTWNGDSTAYITTTKYSNDYNRSGTGFANVLGKMQDKNLLAPIETVEYLQIGTGEYAVSASLNEYRLENGIPVLSEIWGTEMSVPDNNFSESTVAPSGQFIKSNKYRNNGVAQSKVSFNSYTNKGQIEEYQKSEDIVNSYIWSRLPDIPLAKIQNAHATSVAFTGFEYLMVSNDKWINLPSSNNYSSNPASGKAGRFHTLHTNAPLQAFFTPHANDQNASYEFSVWVKAQNQTDGELRVEILNGNNGSNITTIFQALSSTVNTSDWTFEQLSFDLQKIRKDFNISTTTPLKIKAQVVSIANQVSIDEFLVAPEMSLIETYTYDMAHTLIAFKNVHNHYMYYSYDKLKRLSSISDEKGNLRKMFEYNYEVDGLDKNYVKTHDILVAGLTNAININTLSKDEVANSVVYFDGLGKAIQSVSQKAAPNGKDIVKIIGYDKFGRQEIDYFPFATQHTGLYITNAEDIQNSFYGGDANEDVRAYQTVVMENSPLSRTEKVFKGGQKWYDYNISVNSEHRTNKVNEVRLFTNGVSNSFYPSDSLYCTMTRDENFGYRFIYSDKLGREVLKIHEGAKTYYLYDKFGRLSFVIPPKVFEFMEKNNNFNCNDPVIREGIYKYNYDSKGRIIRKTIPGAKQQIIRYDARDRVVLNIDGKGQKIFTKYDALNRPIMTGSYFGNQLPTPSDGLFEKRSASGMQGYTIGNSFPTNNLEIWTVNYYDHYDFNANGTSDQNETFITPVDQKFVQTPSNKTRGLMIGNLNGVFDSTGQSVSQYLLNRSYYDEFGNIVQTIDENRSGQTDILNTAYDFQNQTTAEQLLHRADLNGGTVSKIILKEYEYDHRSRVIKEFIQVDGQNQELLSETAYDDLGRKKYSKLGADVHNASKYLQKVDFSYHLRGWLTGINKYACPESVIGTQIDASTSIGQTQTGSSTHSNSPRVLTQLEENDLFSSEMFYEESSGLGLGVKHDGTISAVTWRNGCTSNPKGYQFNYDQKNQLLAANYYESNNQEFIQTNDFTVDNISYDLNGNILHLERNGLNNAQMDVLEYHIDLNNQLGLLEETGDVNQGFMSNRATAAYIYDDNGNMIEDHHKSMKVSYNFMNLPTVMAFANGDTIVNIYTVAGDKVEQWSKPGTTKSWSKKKYFGPIEYLDEQLEAIYHDHGRITDVNGSGNFQFEYNIKDHLGNIRVTFADLNDNGEIESTEVLQTNEFYPFGMKMETGSALIGSENKYQYNGKEMVNDFGLDWLDYGARWYDPAIAKWHVIDPLAEQFESWSPYNYVMNNPINLIDPDGMAPDTVIASNDLPDRSLNLSQDPNNNSKCECDLEKPQNVENESEVSINVTEDGNYEIEINGETRLTGSIRKIKRLLRKARINEETQQEALDDLSTMGKFRLNQRKLKTRRISKAEGLRINRELKSLSKQERRSAKKQDKNK